MAKNNPAKLKLKPEEESILTFSIALWLQNKGFPNVLKRFLFAAQIEGEDWKAKALNLTEIFSQYQEIRNSAHEVLKYPKQEEQVVETTEKNGDANAATSNEIQSKKTEEKRKRDITVNETGIAQDEKVKKSYINSNEDDENQSTKASKESNGVSELAEDQSSKKQIEVVSEVTELKNFAAELPDEETTVDKKSKKRSHEAAEDGTNKSKMPSKNRKILAPNENENQPAQGVEFEESKSKMPIGLEEGKDDLQQKGEAFESDQVGSQKFSAKQSDDDSSKNAVTNGMDNVSQRKSSNKQPKSSEVPHMSPQMQAPFPPSLQSPSPPPMQAPDGPTSVGTSSSMTCDALDTRILLYIYRGTLMPSRAISSTIRSIMYDSMEFGAHTWAKVSDDQKKRYWETFRTKVRWDPSTTDTELVYKLFRKRAAKRYVDMLNNIKNVWEAEKKRPMWDVNVWNSLVQHWNDPKTKKKSEQCKKNRLSEPGGPGTGYACHKGGSRGAAEVARLIELKTGRPAHDWEIVEYYHRYDNGTYTYGFMGDLLDQVQEELSHMTQENPDASEEGSNQTSPLPELSKLYMKKVERSHGRIKGLGQVGQNRRISSGPGETLSGTSFGQYSQANLDATISEERSLNEERETRLLRQMQESEQRLRQEFARQMRQMKRMISGGSSTIEGGGDDNDGGDEE